MINNIMMIVLRIKYYLSRFLIMILGSSYNQIKKKKEEDDLFNQHSSTKIKLIYNTNKIQGTKKLVHYKFY